MKNENRKTTIGAAIIAKNEAETIARALESLRGTVDRVVLVDTGSADATPKIASRYGANVYFYLWRNDFSVARNFALAHAQTDWILALDADEALAGRKVFEREDVAEALENPEIGGLNVAIKNRLAGGSAKSHRYTRVFRNSPSIRYSGSVHEQISDSITAAGLRIVETDIEIIHYGYEKKSEAKIARNAEALESELEEHPADPWLKLHLAETLFAGGRFDAAEKAIDEALEPENLTELSIEQIENAAIRKAQICLRRDDIAEVEKWLAFISENPETEGFRKFVLAAAALAGRRFKEAEILVRAPETAASEMVPKADLKRMLDLFEKLK